MSDRLSYQWKDPPNRVLDKHELYISMLMLRGIKNRADWLSETISDEQVKMAADKVSLHVGNLIEKVGEWGLQNL